MTSLQVTSSGEPDRIWRETGRRLPCSLLDPQETTLHKGRETGTGGVDDNQTFVQRRVQARPQGRP